MEINTIGVIGAGAMGTGISQVAAMASCRVIIFDTKTEALEKCQSFLKKMLEKLETKNKIESAADLLRNISFATSLNDLKDCNLTIEAIVERLDIKQSVFKELCTIVSDECILASNTSSLSITSIAAACTHPERVIGLHFFNPAPLMPLVEIIPAIQTKSTLAHEMKALMLKWNKVPVIAKDTPGFIVNRVARPFYGEAIRIMEEGIATKEEIDLALTTTGGFRMGPFTLTDYIGHDVNYVVTETVFKSFFYDPRYKPSFSQKRLLEAGWLGRKTKKGFYDYTNGNPELKSNLSKEAQSAIVNRILVLLINEAVDALHLNIASAEDLDLSMTKGVNYPKGLLAWCDELGADTVLAQLDELYDTYREDRYRASPLLRQYAFSNKSFIPK